METDEYCLTPPFRSNATFSPSMAMDVPKELLFLWKTPSASEPSKDIPAVSPLLSYPFILSMALKLIDLQDVVALMTSGNLALMAYLPRHCTSLRYGRRIGALQMAHQPVLKGDPFRTILRFPQLQTLSIISPSWTIPAYDGSPLLHLPRTLRHLTIWARSENTIFERTSFSTLGAISYADQFPDLETLRFCIQHSRDALEPKIKLSSIPKRIRTLSLLSRFFLDSMDIFRICQPVGREMELELLLEGRDKILPQAAFDSADDADPNIPHYRFPEIEHFECFDCAGAIGGSMGIVYHPSPLLMPPTLRSYNMKSDLSLSPLHTRREVREALRTTPSLAHGLRTFVLDSRLARLSQSGTHDWTSSLPSTLTELAVRNVNMEEIAKFDFSLHLPSLRSLTVFGSFDVNKVRLPDTLTSLNFTFVDSSWDPLFSVFPPPSSLTHLGLARISANGLLTLLPATLKSIHYYNWTGEEYLREQVLPYLPRGLRTLRLKVRSFNSNLLRFLPVDLEELSVVADTQIGTPFDLSDLPPRLASFILRTKENNLHFNALYFAQLPRTLRYLELAPVTLALSPLPVLPVAGSSTSTATTSASTGSFGFFSTVKTWIQKIVQDDDQDEVCDGFVKEETIKEALSLLPPDCWCKVRFVASPKAGGFEVDEFVPQPPQLQADLARILPHAATIFDSNEFPLVAPILPSYSFVSRA